jgi:hypothetical protein
LWRRLLRRLLRGLLLLLGRRVCWGQLEGFG